MQIGYNSERKRERESPNLHLPFHPDGFDGVKHISLSLLPSCTHVSGCILFDNKGSGLL